MNERKDGVRLQHRKGRKRSGYQDTEAICLSCRARLLAKNKTFVCPELKLTLRLCLLLPLPPCPSPCLKIHTSILYSEKAHWRVHTRERATPVRKVFGPTARWATCTVQLGSETRGPMRDIWTFSYHSSSPGLCHFLPLLLHRLIRKAELAVGWGGRGLTPASFAALPVDLRQGNQDQSRLKLISG